MKPTAIDPNDPLHESLESVRNKMSAKDFIRMVSAIPAANTQTWAEDPMRGAIEGLEEALTRYTSGDSDSQTPFLQSGTTAPKPGDRSPAQPSTKED